MLFIFWSLQQNILEKYLKLNASLHPHKVKREVCSNHRQAVFLSLTVAGHFLSDSCCCLTMLLCLVWFPFQIARKFTKAAFTYALSLFRREEEKYNASPQARGQTLEITYEDSHCINEVDETQAANPSGRLSKPAHPLLPMLCPCCYIAMCIVLYCYKIARKTFSRLTLNHTHTKCC